MSQEQAAQDDAALSPRTISDDDVGSAGGAPPLAAPTQLPAAAAKSAFSLAAAAKSKLTQKLITPLANVGSGRSLRSSSSSSMSTATASSTPSSSSGASPSVADSAAAGAAYLTAGLASASSSLVSASSSFGSMLFSGTTSPSSSPGASVVMDPVVAAELAAADEELRQASAQQRMRLLEDLVQHRRSDWNYLKLMHEGSNYWLNMALLREQQVMDHLGQKQTIRRGVQFFYLGLGLGRIINEASHPQTLAMDCCQLLEELEFYFSSATVQGMVRLCADAVFVRWERSWI